MNTRTIYNIYVRPPGSQIWTLHMKENHVPWRSAAPDKANQEAIKIINQGKYCAFVKAITVSRNADEEDSRPYAILADGSTLYVGSCY